MKGKKKKKKQRLSISIEIKEKRDYENIHPFKGGWVVSFTLFILSTSPFFPLPN